MAIARYAQSQGLSGCYLPDSVYGPVVWTKRREMMADIRATIEFAGFPAYCIRQVKARRLWQFIKRNGSSVAHFSISHNGREIAYHGLTEAEAEEMESRDY
jgi:hypothetical protein